ncbi:MAG: sialate O-acetylesterase [Bacteroidaceae bacterium]
MKNNVVLRMMLLGIVYLSMPMVYAQLGLPSVFSDGMVLQRNSEATLWGWGDASEKVVIVSDWAPQDTTEVQVDSKGTWRAKLKTAQAGGPYTITLKSGATTLQISNVLLGEVWLCSGQSNMEWNANAGILKGAAEIAAADDQNLRIFQLAKRGADTPQDNCKAQWETSSPSSMRKSSAIAYFFGRYLSDKLQVPVGIIVAAWGGTPAETWTPAQVIAEDSVLSRCKLETTPWWPIEAGKLYNGMIYPIASYNLAGCIWYQGESNHPNASSYARLMQKMIESWRNAFKKDFPFYLVQIAPHTYSSSGNTPALLREQQEFVTQHVPNTEMITISDLVEDVQQIHPKDKRSVGERLGNLALSNVYRVQAGPYRSPTFYQAKRVKNKIVVSFKGLNGKLLCNGKSITGVTICGKEGVYLPAKAKIHKNELVVWAPSIEQPQAVRYCFDDATIGNLFSEEHIPVAPFRTSKE